MNYQKLAKDFLDKYETTVIAEFKDHALLWSTDEGPRDIYNITLSNKKHNYSFIYGQSFAMTGAPPTHYGVLSSVTNSDPGSLNQFCKEYGFDLKETDMEVVTTIHKNVVEEWDNMRQLFTADQLKELKELL